MLCSWQRAMWPESRPHLDLLFQLPLEVLQLLGVGELASGQLGDQCLLLIQLSGQLTWKVTETHSTLEGQALLFPLILLLTFRLHSLERYVYVSPQGWGNAHHSQFAVWPAGW